MKVLVWGGGLGNQIFEYSFYLALRDYSSKQEKIYGVYSKRFFKEHEGGLEIQKVFDISLPSSRWFATLIAAFVFIIRKIHPSTSLYSAYDVLPDNVNWKSICFHPLKPDLRFYKGRDSNWLRFRPVSLSDKNKKLLRLILGSESVSLHIRRGDYLNSKYSSTLGNIATKEYYLRAIDVAYEKFTNPRFFVFSDDIEWCKKSLNIEADYVDWNVGKNSFIDMYLMTFSRMNIIANSTFSYWGAYLNKNNPIVIYPKIWIHNQRVPDIFPVNWIGLDS